MFYFTKEEEAWRQEVSNFVDKEIGREYYRRIEKERIFPYEAWEKFARKGWLGLVIPKEYGGMGANYVMRGIFEECVAKYSLSIASLLHAASVTLQMIISHGTKEQKDYYLPIYRKGDVRFATCLSEPNAGSDAASITTSGKVDGNDLVINGEKVFISKAQARNCVLMASVRTDPTASREAGISMVLVPNTTPGLEIIPLDLIVHKALQTNRIYFRNVRVPLKNLIGKLNEGWPYVREAVAGDRINSAWDVVGMAQTTVDDSIAYAKKRVQFGRPIGKNQAIRHMIADMQTNVNACRLMAYRAALMLDNTNAPPEEVTREVSMAKLFCTETAFKVVNDAMQVFGGYSMMVDMDIERLWRDCRLLMIGGGTSQIQRSIIAHGLGL